MKRFRNSLVIGLAVIGATIAACNDNRKGESGTGNSNTDTNAMDTRRNSTDTVNYITKDSGNNSQNTVDPNPPQNSRY